MTVPAFGEAAARGRKQRASTSPNQRYGVLAGAGAIGIGAGAVTSGYAHGRITAARETDAHKLEELRNAHSAAKNRQASVKRNYDKAGQANRDAVKRYDNFSSWRSGRDTRKWTAILPDEHGFKGGDMVLDRSVPGHRKYIEQEHDRLAARGVETEREYYRLMDAHDAAKESSKKAHGAVKGFKPTAESRGLRGLAHGGKVGAAIGVGALAAGIYGIERSRQHPPAPVRIQPRYAPQAVVGHKQLSAHETDQIKAQRQRSVLAQGSGSGDIDQWLDHGHQFDHEKKATSKRIYGA